MQTHPKNMFLVFVSMECGPYVITLLNRTPTIDWYKSRLVSKNKHQEDMCHIEIGLCAQNELTIPGSIINTIKRGY